MSPRKKPAVDRIQFTPVMKWRGRLLRFVRNRFILKLHAVVTTTSAHEDQLKQFLKGENIHVRRMNLVGELAVVDVEPPAVAQDRALLDTIDRLRGLRGQVEFAEPDLRMHALQGPRMPTDPGLTFGAGYKQWGWLHIGMPAVWETHPGNDHVVVAVIDTGLNDHDDLPIARADERKIYDPAPGAIVNGDVSIATGDSDHGMRVCGIIAAEIDNATGITGLNAESRLYFCKVEDLGDASVVATTASIIYTAVLSIIEYAVSEDLKAVVNLSWAADLTSNSLTEPAVVAARAAAENTLRTMCQDAETSGRLILCCGAGNVPLIPTTGLASTVESPANLASDYGGAVMSVGATSATLDQFHEDNVLDVWRGDLPNGVRGREVQEGIWMLSAGNRVETVNEITVVAPGDQIRVLKPADATGEDTDLDAGTSLATAFVTGVASLVWSAKPDRAPADIIEALKTTALLPAGMERPSTHWGHGRISVPGAIEAVRPPPVLELIVDLTGDEVAKLQRIAEILRRLIDIVVPHLRVGVGGSGGAGAPIGSDYRQLETAFLKSMRGPSGRLDQKLQLALQDLNAHAGAIQRPMSILAITGDSRPLGSNTIVAMESAGIPVYVAHVGTSRSPAFGGLRRLAAATHGDIASATDWPSDVDAGFWFARSVMRGMGRKTVVEKSSNGRDPVSEIAFDFVLDRNDLDLDVIMLHPGSGLSMLSLKINGVDLMAAPAPGTSVMRGDGYVHARIATATAATIGRWRGQAAMTGAAVDRTTAMAVLITKRSRG